VLDQAAHSEEHRRIIATLGIHSAIVVPLRSRGRVFAVLSLIRMKDRAPFTEADFELAKDLGTRAALSAENARLYGEAQRAIEMREEILAVVSHDLRNPLNAISLAASSLSRREDVPDVARKPAARIASSAQRMNRLIGELLDFARSQHGSIPIKPESCTLSEIASEVAAEMKVVHPDRDIRIEPQGGCHGRWDRARMAQVFQNLIGNAVEHGASDSPVTVKTGGRDRTAWATVKNRGNPIPSEERARIFEPFRSTRTSQGLGLGLYIARAIVAAHGGRIDVESDDQQTTFTLELPAVAKEHPEEDQPAA